VEGHFGLENSRGIPEIFEIRKFWKFVSRANKHFTTRMTSPPSSATLAQRNLFFTPEQLAELIGTFFLFFFLCVFAFI